MKIAQMPLADGSESGEENSQQPPSLGQEWNEHIFTQLVAIEEWPQVFERTRNHRSIRAP
jgi:hypothetical protein